MIPTHLTDGRLPAGEHTATWQELVDTFGSTPRRRALLVGLSVALLHLRDAGCERVWVGGSFVRTKPNPMDVDVVWDVTGVNPDLLHPAFLTPDAREWTKMTFGAEFFPSLIIEAATDRPMIEFFQFTRDGQRCGIVVVDLHTMESET